MPRSSPQRFVPHPPMYAFRVRLLGGFRAPTDTRSVWREIEVAANQTLAVLGTAIPEAFGFVHPHLWSFFLSGKAWDDNSEYTITLPNPFGAPAFVEQEPEHPADEILIRDVPYPGKTGKKEFLFLFDYNDEWRFGVKLLRTSPTLEAGITYPRVSASEGAAPPQFPQRQHDVSQHAEVGETFNEETGKDQGRVRRRNA